MQICAVKMAMTVTCRIGARGRMGMGVSIGRFLTFCLV